MIRPGVIWGPGDTTIVPRLAALLRRGRLVFIGRGANQLGLSHVENLSQGLILAALAPAAAGQTYHLTDGEEITARDRVLRARRCPGRTAAAVRAALSRRILPGGPAGVEGPDHGMPPLRPRSPATASAWSLATAATTSARRKANSATGRC